MAYTNALQGRGDKAKQLRKDAGAYLRSLREQAELTQAELASRLGFAYYTYISQIEAGKASLPAERYRDFAMAVDIDPKELVKNLMKFYDPYSYSILFGNPRKPI